jgi:hydrogenase maturation protease
MARIGVLGIGNVLMGDDALGPCVVKLLDSRYELPGDVGLLDLGTPGADLPLYLDGLEAAVIVDAVRVSGAPGEVHLLDKAQLLSRSPVLPASPHEPGLREGLFTLEFQGRGPGEVRLVGVVPSTVESAIGLSLAVRSALPAALAAVVRELEGMGVALRERQEPRPPDLWWERQPLE